jgi:DNA polymerase-1
MKELYRSILESVEKEHETNTNRHHNSRVLIIDGLNTYIRCWSSIPTMNDDGDHVGGVSGFLKSIGYAIRQTQPTRVVIVFDGKGGSQRRKKAFSGYKSERTNKQLRVNRQYADLMNEEDERESMKRQFVWLNDLLTYLPVTTMIYDNVEADDVMAYIATQILKEGEQGVIMSTDKDFLQLVDEKTIVWSPTKKKIYNRKLVKEEFGIDARNMLTYRVFDGDTSDNIPGVYGCGMKTMLKRFPELGEEIQLDPEDIIKLSEERIQTEKLKLYENIIQSKEQILLNKELMQLKDPDISGQIKMKILDRFNEEVKLFNKMDFLKVCLKYKVVNNFGDINSWLKETFSSLVHNGN